jgi:3-dehydroquinate dehydratase
VICGLGPLGYELALTALAEHQTGERLTRRSLTGQL